MKRLLSVFVLSLAFTLVCFPEEIVTLQNGRQIVVYDDFTWNYVDQSNARQRDFSQIRDNDVPSFLRQGIPAKRDEIIHAIEMYDQGWRYTMPRPKSSQAAWGNSDGRTTWYNGWWYNSVTHAYSTVMPTAQYNRGPIVSSELLFPHEVQYRNENAISIVVARGILPHDMIHSIDAEDWPVVAGGIAIEDVRIAGRYIDHWVYTDGAWKVTRSVAVPVGAPL